MSPFHSYIRSRLDAILSKTVSSHLQVLVSLPEDQLNQSQDPKLKDDHSLLFSSNKKNNIANITDTAGSKSLVDSKPKKEPRWWDPLPEYNFNWYKWRWEQMSQKEKDEQFWPDTIAIVVMCGMLICFVNWVASYGMYGRDRFWEFSTRDKIDETEKVNFRKNEKPKEAGGFKF